MPIPVGLRDIWPPSTIQNTLYIIIFFFFFAVLIASLHTYDSLEIIASCHLII